MVNLTKKILRKKIIIQGILAVLLYSAAFIFKISLIYIAIGAIITGVIFGKVFCRWMCPIGFIMELMMMGKKSEDNMQHQYMYHKAGCPIAWITGFLNKYSLFKINKDSSKCISCGKCDKSCYIATIDSKYSVYD